MISNGVKTVKICSVDGCSRSVRSKDLCEKHRTRLRRHGDANIALLNYGEGETPEERFWSRVKKNANEKGCWEWQGSKDFDGYGQVQIYKKHLRTHIYSWFLANGEYPESLLRHTCDNPPCVNPSHLVEGSHQDNHQDAVSRNRHAKGETHGMSKLNDDKVREARKLIAEGLTNREISAKLGVTPYPIYAIRKDKAWRHVK